MKGQQAQKPQNFLKGFVNQKPRQNNYEDQEMSPQSAIRAISMIFTDDPAGDAAHFSPQAKIILLTLVLSACVYAMYTIYEFFLDTIILSFLLGVTYVRLRERFILFCKRSSPSVNNNRSSLALIWQSLICGALFVLIPWLNSEFSDVSDFSSWTELFHAKINENVFAKILDTFYRTNNVIKAIQLYLLMTIITNIFGRMLQRLFYFIKARISHFLLQPTQQPQSQFQTKSRIQDLLHKIFAVLFVIWLLLIGIFVAGIVFELSGMINSAGRAIEKYNNCTFYSLSNQTEIQQCTDVITGTLKPYLPNVENKHEISACVEEITKTQEQYLNFTFIQYKKEMCLVYQMIKQYSPQAIDQILNIQTTKQYLTTILKNFIGLLSLTSDAIFSLTIFPSIFFITVKSYTSAERKLSMFGQSISKLFSQVTDLISDYIMVTLKHICLSLAIFQVFQFSEANIVLSLLIGFITLFPFISVTFIMVIFSIVKYYFAGPHDQMAVLSTILSLILFYFGSGHIFSNHFNKIDFNKALLSLSAVFGLYRFGVAGIFYGPLVILLFQSAFESLSKSKI